MGKILCSTFECNKQANFEVKFRFTNEPIVFFPDGSQKGYVANYCETCRDKLYAGNIFMIYEKQLTLNLKEGVK